MAAAALKKFVDNLFTFDTRTDLQLWAQQAVDNKFTPDIHKLEQYEFQLLFVWGTDMPGYCHHEALFEEGYAVYGTAFSPPDFSMWKMTDNDGITFAIPLRQSYTKVPTARIKGELLIVRPRTFISLDNFYENKVAFVRRRVEIAIPYRKLKWYKDREMAAIFHNKYLQSANISVECPIVTVTAWMYWGKLPVWEPQLDGGFTFQPVRRYRAHRDDVGEYYHFSKKEYDE